MDFHIALRTTFDWGTARVQQGLTELPDYAEEWKRRTILNLYLSIPDYPRDKRKVERAIRNMSEEFIYLLKNSSCD